MHDRYIQSQPVGLWTPFNWNVSSVHVISWEGTRRWACIKFKTALLRLAEGTVISSTGKTFYFLLLYAVRKVARPFFFSHHIGMWMSVEDWVICLQRELLLSAGVFPLPLIFHQLVVLFASCSAYHKACLTPFPNLYWLCVSKLTLRATDTVCVGSWQCFLKSHVQQGRTASSRSPTLQINKTFPSALTTTWLKIPSLCFWLLVCLFFEIRSCYVDQVGPGTHYVAQVKP